MKVHVPDIGDGWWITIWFPHTVTIQTL